MKQIIFLLGFVFVFTSCKIDGDKNESKAQSEELNYVDYFYPTDSLIPYIYVFQNVDEPLDEKVFRIYRSESPEDTSLVVELYNSDFKITEGYTHDLNPNFNVKDHMIVDGDGMKRKAKLSSTSFFPKNNEDKTQFLSDFPSHLDSITMIYQSKRRILEVNKMVNVLGDSLPAIIIGDSVRVLLANAFTQKSSSQSVLIKRTFAKGYGMVRWSANNGDITYELINVLPNSWWEEYGQTPQIKQ